MVNGYVSAPLLEMLQAANIRPSAVQRSVINRAAKHVYPVLRTPHPYVRRLQAATGLDVTKISWRYGRLLVSIAQMEDGRVSWGYEEFKGSHCSFRCPAVLPEAVVIALKGKPLCTLTDTIAVLADVTISGIDHDLEPIGGLALKLTPDWIAF